MAGGRFGRLANRANLLGRSGRFLLDEDDAVRRFDQVVSIVRREWHATMKRAGLSERDRESIASAFMFDGLLEVADGE